MHKSASEDDYRECSLPDNQFTGVKLLPEGCGNRLPVFLLAKKTLTQKMGPPIHTPFDLLGV